LANGFAAPMNDDRVNANGFQKDDITQQAFNQMIVLHSGASVLDDKGVAPELLDERQSVD
jgi:hypothetical protein